MPRATEAVPGMIAVIGRLIERGHAYAVGPTGQQTVYFSVASFPAYGKLSGNTLDALRSGEGGRVQESHQAEKRHPGDFLLWKSDPSHAMRWLSPWGEGYPGWHIECSAMSAARLLAADGRGPLTPEELAGLVIDDAMPMIDLHSGGEDNIFPHHECEIAQSCCAFNAAPGEVGPARGMYAAHWFHPRFLMVEGAKMSKSKGNFFTPRELFEKGHEPAAVRLELIKTHYRSNANFTEQGLRDSARMVERWRRVIEQGDAAAERGVRNDAVASSVADAFSDDLNVSAAIGAINAWTGPLGSPTRADAALLREFDAVLGVLSLDRPAAASTDIGLFIPPATPTPEITTLLSDRAAARAAKDFKRSDAIRDQLAAMGYAIKDVAEGKVEVRKA
jgi:cysteinyl-tRNA synthetase